MAEPEKCAYCWHPYHGRAESGTFAGTMIKTTENGRCHEVLNAPRERECNCDGRMQWFSSPPLSKEHALEWARRAEVAGYNLYVFNEGDIAVNLVNAEGEYLDSCMATAFSETLPPVSSVSEFNQRINWPTNGNS